MSAKVINIPAASCARGLDIDGINKCNSVALRPRVRGREKMLCTWREACKAARLYASVAGAYIPGLNDPRFLALGLLPVRPVYHLRLEAD